jgi:hypothetical protein
MMSMKGICQGARPCNFNYETDILWTKNTQSI